VARLITVVDDCWDNFGLPVITPVVLRVVDDSPAVERLPDAAPDKGLILAPTDCGGHVLFADGEASGLTDCPLVAGVCRLIDGDRIRLGPYVLEYSAIDWIDPDRVEACTGGGFCVVNKDPLEPGSGVVYCPRCRMAMHPTCLDSQVEACPVCGCPVAHSYEEALAIARGSQKRGW